jgi:NADH-quinone oxidoreductase subunit J
MIENVLLGFFMAGALAGALAMLVIRHPMRVALALVGTMLSLAGAYAMLGAHAVAVFQILIYVGAVMVFMVYVIMLLDMRDTSLAGRYSWLLVPGVIAFLVLLFQLGGEVWTYLPQPSATTTPIGVQPFSVAFLNDYWLYFELVSILLVAAIVAALAVIQIGRPKKRG